VRFRKDRIVRDDPRSSLNAVAAAGASRAARFDDLQLSSAPPEAREASGYAVGFGRPPSQTRFKPGQSGNPKGRPVGRSNAKTTMARVINESIPVREGQRTRNMTKLEAMFHMKAVKGDARSAGIVLGFAKQMGLLTDTESETGAALPEERRCDPE
jgi:hypothetical protein